MVYSHEHNKAETGEIKLEEVLIGQESFYKISNAELMRPFFMTIVSDSDHWMFVSSNGGISAGRKNAEYALFPYYTDDKIIESAEITGSKTILRMIINGQLVVWEPFSARSEALYKLQRNVYKNRYGNKIIFEEVNKDLSLTFSYEWNSSHLYGFVRKARLTNHATESISVEVLDGLQNVLPYGVASALQNTTSNLADAYKRSELLPDCGIGIFALSAIIVDKAEPSEALKANLVWSAGLNNPLYLLSAGQLGAFRNGKTLEQEEDVKGEKGAYFISGSLQLAGGEEWNWLIAADVNQSQSTIIRLADAIRNNPQLVKDVLADTEKGTLNLAGLVAAADGLQYSADEAGNTRHLSNTLFNIMRGGIFDNHYSISKKDFVQYLRRANLLCHDRNKNLLESLPAEFSLLTLKALTLETGDTDLTRLATEYLPLRFSRRHGDPSRPWNKFTINIVDEDSREKILNYEGNWRDIFQNWEALAHSYPAFVEGMIFKFLNASTFDGYNPYRVTKDGFDWETIEPDNPWSYIGYWGDHQVIYLLKFLEFADARYPHCLADLLDKACFVYAHVPYRIASYRQILTNPKDTIAFDHTADLAIRKNISKLGADGALLADAGDSIHKVNLAEKLLAMLLAKLSNFVPGGGIWMNTQRPEWNDANNALVGNGLSMVTLYYLRRFLLFAEPLFVQKGNADIPLSSELQVFFAEVASIFEKYAAVLPEGPDSRQKKKMLDELGEAASLFRETIYTKRFSGTKTSVSAEDIASLFRNAILLCDYSIRVNARPDGLYHTYNLLSYTDTELSVSHLDEMLEGQVAVLSSCYLSPAESLRLLDALRQSSLYRADQESYILYPNKSLPRFLEKNNVPADAVQSIPLLRQLLAEGDNRIIEKDIAGGYHFHGLFKNAADLDASLQLLADEYPDLLTQDRATVLNLFEQVFHHKAFTGRSGTFFAYEGLGSIYWHMVSKLLLAVQETFFAAEQNDTDKIILEKLAGHFHAIKKGIGVHKSPVQYGAFPTDPYSHTPLGKGAQQPGMTGQVKEDIISRFGESGIYVKNGCLHFEPVLLQSAEFLLTAREVTVVSITGDRQIIALPKDSLLFTICQVPVIYELKEQAGIHITFSDGRKRNDSNACLTEEETENLFNRSGHIITIRVSVDRSCLFNQ